ncbi:Protein kinase protein rad53 [Friedmanniomyces endolithicus]|nr:Protein kinase protein rad53 [Friedmanniomyces endolithicus]
MPLTVNDDIVYCRITVLLGLTDVSKEEQNAQYITDSSPEYKRFGSGRQTTRDATPELREMKLAMTIDPMSMKQPDRGHVFGCDRDECDVLLDVTNYHGVSSTHFRLQLEYDPDAKDFLYIIGMTNKPTLKIDNKHVLNNGTQLPLKPRRDYYIQAGTVLLNIVYQGRPFDVTVMDQLKAARLRLREAIGSRTVKRLRRDTPRFSHKVSSWITVPEVPWRYGGKYQLLTAVLGQERYATVRKARRLSDDSIVAVKIIGDGKVRPSRYSLHDHLSPPDQQSREINTMLHLRHSNITRLLDYAVYDAEPFATLLALELAPYGTLRDVFQAPPGEQMCKTVTEQVLEGLRYLHRFNIIHRDINPSNILVFDYDVLNFHCKIADFTHAESISLGTLPANAQGTAAYMSLECAQGKRCDHKVDVFACGKVALWLLTGDDQHPTNEDQSLPDRFAGNALDQMVSYLKAWDCRGVLRSAGVTQPCEEFLCSILDNDAILRPSATDSLQHPWFTEYNHCAGPTILGESSTLINQLDHPAQVTRELRASSSTYIMSVPTKGANPQVVAAGLCSTIAQAARPDSAQTPAVLQTASGRSQHATDALTTDKVLVIEVDSERESVVVFDTSCIQVTGSGLRLVDDASSAAPLELEGSDHPDFIASTFANGPWDDLPSTRAPSEDRASGSGTPSSALWDLEKAILLQVLPAISEDAPEAYGRA